MPDRCHCGADAARLIGTQPMCATHADELLEPIRARVLNPEGLAGVGRLCGRVRPDMGAGSAEVACDACGATWVALAGSPCPWCIAARARLAAWQAELVLTPPDVHHDDARWPEAMRAWRERLTRAFEAGLVSEAQLLGAYHRATTTDTTQEAA